MSTLENLKIDDLGLEFANFGNEERDSFSFGPSKNCIKKFIGWDGYDGKFFQPYSDQDKVGKLADFVGAAIQATKDKERELDNIKRKQDETAKKAEKKFGKKVQMEDEEEDKEDEGMQEDDDGFTTIEDKQPVMRKQQGKQQMQQKQTHWSQRQNNNTQKQNKPAQGGEKIMKHGDLKAKSKKDVARQNYYLSNQVKMLRCNLRDNAMDVKQEWELVTEFTKQTFDRVPYLKPVLISTEKECGEIMMYDTSLDKASAKKPKTIPAFKGKTFEESLFDDNVMVDLIENDKADIFTTDVVISILMCATKSNYSWDIEIKKFGDKIFIDKRADAEQEEGEKVRPNILDYQTVNETALEHQPMDTNDINGIWPLMKEAKTINDSFLNASHSSNLVEKIQLEDENPFIEEENQIATRCGYVYKIWRIQEADEATGKKEKRICIRCSIHSHNGRLDESGKFKKQTMNVYAFNEFAPNTTNWRSRIDTKLIPCMNEEIKNNSFKVSRWLCQSLLADVDFIKFGFISRKEENNNTKHHLLTTHTVPTHVWAKEMACQMENMWSKVKHLVETIEEDQKETPDSAVEFILLKDFNRMCIRLYRNNEQDEDEEGEEEQEEAN